MGSIGNNAIIAVGKKDSKGAVPSSWEKLRARSVPINDDINFLNSEALTGNRFKSKGMAISTSVSGSLTTEGNREELRVMLPAAGFSVDTSTPDIEVYEVNPTIANWLDIIVHRTDELVTEKFKDVKIDSIQIDISAKSFTTIQYSVEGIDVERSETLTETIADPVDPRFVCLDVLVNLAGNDVTAKLRDMSIKLNNNIDKEDYPINSISRSSLDAQSSTLEISGTIEFTKADYETYKTQLRNSESVQMVIDLDSKVKLTYPEFTFSEVSAPVDTPDKIRISFSGEATVPDTGESPMQVTIDLTDY